MTFLPSTIFTALPSGWEIIDNPTGTGSISVGGSAVEFDASGGGASNVCGQVETEAGNGYSINFDGGLIEFDVSIDGGGFEDRGQLSWGIGDVTFNATYGHAKDANPPFGEIPIDTFFITGGGGPGGGVPSTFGGSKHIEIHPDGSLWIDGSDTGVFVSTGSIFFGDFEGDNSSGSLGATTSASATFSGINIVSWDPTSAAPPGQLWVGVPGSWLYADAYKGAPSTWQFALPHKL